MMMKSRESKETYNFSHVAASASGELRLNNGDPSNPPNFLPQLKEESHSGSLSLHCSDKAVADSPA